MKLEICCIFKIFYLNVNVVSFHLSFILCLKLNAKVVRTYSTKCGLVCTTKQFNYKSYRQNNHLFVMITELELNKTHRETSKFNISFVQGFNQRSTHTILVSLFIS